MNQPDQLAMFDLPTDEAPPQKLTPGCLLPVQQSRLVDVARVASILQVAPMTVRSFIERGCFPAFRLVEKQSWSIPYDGVVEFCNRLRMQFMIRDRRPRLAAGIKRWRDEDLLPFPWADTISVREAAVGFDTRIETILMLINDRAPNEEGVFDAYQFTEVSPWRISRSSIVSYAAEWKRKLGL